MNQPNNQKTEDTMSTMNKNMTGNHSDALVSIEKAAWAALAVIVIYTLLYVGTGIIA